MRVTNRRSKKSVWLNTSEYKLKEDETRDDVPIDISKYHINREIGSDGQKDN